MSVLFKNEKDKIWKRLNTPVEYAPNNINYEGKEDAKYKTLSFIYKIKSTNKS